LLLVDRTSRPGARRQRGRPVAASRLPGASPLRPTHHGTV